MGWDGMGMGWGWDGDGMGGCGGAVKGGTSLVLGQEVGIELRWLQHNPVQCSAVQRSAAQCVQQQH